MFFDRIGMAKKPSNGEKTTAPGTSIHQSPFRKGPSLGKVSILGSCCCCLESYPLVKCCNRLSPESDPSLLRAHVKWHLMSSLGRRSFTHDQFNTSRYLQNLLIGIRHALVLIQLLTVVGFKHKESFMYIALYFESLKIKIRII